MVASITFRLKSSTHVGTIDMDGSVMSCRDAQQAIAAKLCARPEEINIFLAGSSSLLHPNENLPAYAVVDVVRQTYSGKPLFAARPKPAPLPSALDGVGPSNYAGGGNGDVSADGQPLNEEERLAQLQAEAALDTGIDEVSSRFRRGGRGIGRGRGSGRGGAGGVGGDVNGAGGGEYYFSGGRGRGDAIRANMEENFRRPPKGYICHNCGKGGHLILHCPSAKGGKTRKVLSSPDGIPESMLVECSEDDPAPKFITRDHRYVKRRVDPSVFSTITLAGLGAGEAKQDEYDDDHIVVSTISEALANAAPDTSADPAASNTNGGTATTSVDPSAAASAPSSSSPSPPPPPATAALAIDSAYVCVVDHVVAREAMKLPCCGRLLCNGCFTKMAEEAFDETRSLEDEDGGVVCPACGEPLIMDEVVPATAEREKIKEIIAARKREREA